MNCSYGYAYMLTSFFSPFRNSELMHFRHIRCLFLHTGELTAGVPTDCIRIRTFAGDNRFPPHSGA